MSNYRIIFLLCRALSTFFFWNALFGTFATGGAVMGFGAGLGSYNFLVSLVCGALLRFFSITIASTIVGQNVFEGEALSSQFEKDPQFKALARAFTGLLMLVFGASQLLSSTLSLGSAYYAMGSSTGRSYVGMLAIWLLVPALEIGLGIFFAFGGALKRISRSISGATLASPHETESKNDSSP